MAPQNDPYALPCGHNQGAAWDTHQKAWTCRVCRTQFLANADQELEPMQQTIYSPINQTPKPNQAPKYDDAWRNSTDITPTLDAHAWECLACGGTNAARTRQCQYCKQPRANGSPVTAIADIPPAKRPQKAPEQKTIFDFPGILAHILDRKPQQAKKETPPAAPPFQGQ